VDVAYYRTRLKNAHGTAFRELLYPWHPWSTMRVAVHEATAKTDGVVLRCTLSGLDVGRWLEVPAWMFEPAACLDYPRPTDAPKSPRHQPAACGRPEQHFTSPKLAHNGHPMLAEADAGYPTPGQALRSHRRGPQGYVTERDIRP
jgi:hypothetical protein